MIDVHDKRSGAAGKRPGVGGGDLEKQERKRGDQLQPWQLPGTQMRVTWARVAAEKCIELGILLVIGPTEVIDD